MKAHGWVTAGPICLLLVSTLCSGCSLLGLAVDMSREPDTLAVEPGEAALEGKSLLVTLKDGYSIAGECRRAGELPAELYRARYREWEGTPVGQAIACRLSDTLHTAWGQGRIAVGRLEGFTQTSLLLFPLSKPAMPFPRTPQVLSIQAGSIDSIWRTDGTLVNIRLLTSLLEEGRVPTTGGVLLRRAGTSVWIPESEIARMTEVQRTYEWFHTGALADAAGLAAVIVFFATRNP